jgi:hypothetical protein
MVSSAIICTLPTPQSLRLVRQKSMYTLCNSYVLCSSFLCVAPLRPRICGWFVGGQCKYGTKCRNRHPTPEEVAYNVKRLRPKVVQRDKGFTPHYYCAAQLLPCDEEVYASAGLCAYRTDAKGSWFVFFLLSITHCVWPDGSLRITPNR